MEVSSVYVPKSSFCLIHALWRDCNRRLCCSCSQHIHTRTHTHTSIIVKKDIRLRAFRYTDKPLLPACNLSMHFRFFQSLLDSAYFSCSSLFRLSCFFCNKREISGVTWHFTLSLWLPWASTGFVRVHLFCLSVLWEHWCGRQQCLNMRVCVHVCVYEAKLPSSTIAHLFFTRKSNSYYTSCTERLQWV